MEVASATSLDQGKSAARLAAAAGGESGAVAAAAAAPAAPADAPPGQPGPAVPAAVAEAVVLEVATAPNGAPAPALTEEEALFEDAEDAAPLRVKSTKVPGVAAGAGVSVGAGACASASVCASPPWLTLAHKLLVRDVMTLLCATSLSFVPAFRRATSGFDSLTPIIALVTSLGPPLIYTIGSETQLLVNMLIFTPPQVAWAYVIFAAGTSAGVYIGLAFVYVFIASICVFRGGNPARRGPGHAVPALALHLARS
jgi:hypothetical protein